MNWLAILGAALIPLVIGFIWYHPMAFGRSWMKAAGLTEENLKGGNMAVIFGFSILFSLMLSFAMTGITIHQNNLPGLFQNGPNPPAPGSEEAIFIEEFFEKYGDLHRTFTHGMLHGVFGFLFFGLPIIGINALFERKGAKYILVHAGYWLLTIMLMGGVVCQWS